MKCSVPASQSAHRIDPLHSDDATRSVTSNLQRASQIQFAGSLSYREDPSRNSATRTRAFDPPRAVDMPHACDVSVVGTPPSRSPATLRSGLAGDSVLRAVRCVDSGVSPTTVNEGNSQNQFCCRGEALKRRYFELLRCAFPLVLTQST